MTKTTKKAKADYKTSGVSYPYPELEEDNGERILWPVVISLIGHLVLLTVLVFVPQPSFEKSYAPAVISVRMISPGDIQAEAPASEDVAEKNSAPKPEPPRAEETRSEPEISAEPPEPKMSIVEKRPTPPPVKEPEPEVSLAPKEKTPEKPKVKEAPKIKTSLKKKTYKPSEIVRNAVEKLEKETEQSRPKTVLDAIEKLRKDVAERQRKAPSSEKTASAGEGGKSAGGAGSGSGRTSGSGPGGILDGVYRGEVAHHIQRNWAFSEQLARGRKDLEVLVGIKIMPDGRIEDVWIDKKSGNQYLDDSAIRAVKKSSPLPPLPKHLGRRPYVIGLKFTPEGFDR